MLWKNGATGLSWRSPVPACWLRFMASCREPGHSGWSKRSGLVSRCAAGGSSAALRDDELVRANHRTPLSCTSTMRAQSAGGSEMESCGWLIPAQWSITACQRLNSTAGTGIVLSDRGRDCGRDRGRDRDCSRGRGRGHGLCPIYGRGRHGRDRHPSSLQSNAVRRDEVPPNGRRCTPDGSSILRATYSGCPPDTSSPLSKNSRRRDTPPVPLLHGAGAARRVLFPWKSCV